MTFKELFSSFLYSIDYLGVHPRHRRQQQQMKKELEIPAPCRSTRYALDALGDFLLEQEALGDEEKKLARAAQGKEAKLKIEVNNGLAEIRRLIQYCDDEELRALDNEILDELIHRANKEED